MNNQRTGLALAAVLSAAILLNGTLALAKSHGAGGNGTPPGFGKGEKKGWQGESKPPGWSKGKKKGWKDAGMPPGLAKKQETTTPAQPAQT